MMNKVILIGRLTADPELRKTSLDNSVCSFTIAVNRIRRSNSEQQEKEADFINCVAWRNQADNLVRFMKKGSLIGVEGRLQQRSYQAKDGSNRVVFEVQCDNISFLESKSSQSIIRENSYYEENSNSFANESYNEEPIINDTDDDQFPW